MKKSLLNRLTPREPKFFPLLQQMSSVLSDASTLLTDCLGRPTHEERVEVYRQVKAKEKEGDRVSDTIFDELNSTFITPFDREDIHDLAELLDDVIDGINSCAKKAVLYKPKRIYPSAVQLASILGEAAVEIASAVDELDVLKKTPANIRRYCDNLHAIEERGDDVYERSIMELFCGDEEAIEIIKLKEIVLELETTIDAAENVGKLIKTIIVKYA